MRRSNLLAKEIGDAATLAFREFVPKYEQRRLLTWRTFPQAFLYLVPYFFMAFLVRRRDTRLVRVLLLPTVIAMAVRCTWGHTVGSSWYTWYEWDRGILALIVIAKSVDFACAKDGRRRIGETELRQIGGLPLEGASSASSRNGLVACLPDSVYDALEIGLSMRGVGWDFGAHVYVPPATQPRERRAFARAALARVARHFLCIDLLDTLIKFTPGLGPHGGTIFFASLAPVPRYALSTAIHLAQGVVIACGMALMYDALSLAGVLVLGQPPAAWPPIDGGALSGVWRVRSLHEFWARRWHQALRYVFLVCGGLPGRWIGGGVGATIGTFLASGLVHELGITVAGVETDWRVVGFFLLQAAGVVLEKAYRRVVGKRVGGLLGFAWAIIFVLGFGQMCTDAWAARGIGGGVTIPVALSPMRTAILPLIRHLVYTFSTSTS